MSRNLSLPFSIGVFLLISSLSYSQSASGGVEDLPAVEKKDTLWVDDLIGTAQELRLSDPVTSISLLEEAYEIADSLEDIPRMGRSKSYLGAYYFDLGSHGQALDALFQALSLYETIGDAHLISNTHHSLSNVYRRGGDFEKALEQEEIALEMKLQAKESRSLPACYSALGSIYAQLGQYEKALSSHQKGLDLSLEFDVAKVQGEILGNMANVFNMKREFKAARSYHFRALDFLQQGGNTTPLVIEMNNLAYNYQEAGLLDSARYYYLQSYIKSEMLGSHLFSLIPAKGLWEVLSDQGKYKLANDWAEIVLELQDSVTTTSYTAQMKTAEVRNDLLLRSKETEFQKQAEQLKKEVALQRQRTISLGAIIVGLLLAVVALIFYFRFKGRKRTAETLERTVEDRTADLSLVHGKLIEEAMEKEKAQKILSNFLYRSSHDLRGPVTSIKGLLNIEALLPEKSPYHDMIYLKVEQLEGVLSSLVEKLELDNHEIKEEVISWENCWESTLHTLESRSGFEVCQLKFENKTTGPVKADPFLIQVAMHQLVRNAIDFRDRDKKEHFCYVSVGGQGDNWTLGVKDNGIGIPTAIQDQVYEMFFRGNKRSRGAGIGLYLVQEISTLLGYKVLLRSEERDFTQIEIQCIPKATEGVLPLREKEA